MHRPLLRALSVTTLLLSGSAWAQEERVHLQYQAGPGCPNRAAFIEQIALRTPRPRFVTEPEGVRSFVVSVEVAEGRAVGRLATGQENALGSTREVESGNCNEVASALALIMALAIDPKASTAALPPPRGPDPDAPDAAQNSTAAPPAKPTSDEPTPAPAAKTAHPTSRRSSLGSELPGHPPSRNVFQLGAQAEGSAWFGTGSVPLGGIAIFAEWGRSPTTGFSPAFRLSGMVARSREIHPGEGGAQFAVTSGELDFCPLHLRLTGSVALLPCLGAEGGLLVGEGIPRGRIVQKRSAQRPWGVVHQALRFQATFGHTAVLHLEAGLGEPIWQDEFVFQTPDLTIVRIPALVPKLGIGLALRF